MRRSPEPSARADALEDARLHAREREARERMERLQAFRAALAEAAGAPEWVDVVVREGLVALGAQGAPIFRLSEDGKTSNVRARSGIRKS